MTIASESDVEFVSIDGSDQLAEHIASLAQNRIEKANTRTTDTDITELKRGIKVFHDLPDMNDDALLKIDIDVFRRELDIRDAGGDGEVHDLPGGDYPYKSAIVHIDF